MHDRFRRPVWLWVVPIVALILAGIAWHVPQVSTAARASDRFKLRTSMIRTLIEQRLQGQIHLLVLAAGDCPHESSAIGAAPDDGGAVAR